MKILKHINTEYTEVNINELYGEMRIDSEYYEPFYIRNAEKIQAHTCKAIKEFMFEPEYGISVAMNEKGSGYKILKMDDIIDVLANDETVKFANIAEKLFKQFKLQKFDVLFNRVNSDEYVGRTGIYLLDGDHTFASYLIRLSSEHSYQNCFLTIFLNCRYGYHTLQRIKRRAVNQANINAQELKSLNIPFPSSSFQKRIKKLVVDAYELRSHSTDSFKFATNILLKELQLESWTPKHLEYQVKTTTFETFDTASEILLSDVIASDRLDSEYWQQYLTLLEKKLLSYENGCKMLGDVCKIHDFNFKLEEDEYYNYIELSNVGLFGNVLNQNTEQGKNLPTRARRLVRASQVIVSSIEGSLESCALITSQDDYSICSNGFYVIDSDILNSETLVVLLKSHPIQYLLRKACTGTILTAINPKNFRKIILPIIRKEIQEEIKEKITIMYQMRQKAHLLLRLAEKAVEIFVEDNEASATDYLANSTVT